MDIYFSLIFFLVTKVLLVPTQSLPIIVLILKSNNSQALSLSFQNYPRGFPAVVTTSTGTKVPEVNPGHHSQVQHSRLKGGKKKERESMNFNSENLKWPLLWFLLASCVGCKKTGQNTMRCARRRCSHAVRKRHKLPQEFYRPE